MQPTTLVLTFSSALDAASAHDMKDYQIITLGGHGRGGALIGHSTAVREATYDPSTFTVTLAPVHRLDIHNRYRLTVDGTTRTGVRGISGLLLDGNGDGNPGSNFVAEINRRTLAGAAPGFARTLRTAAARNGMHAGGPSEAGFNMLAASGELGTVADINWAKFGKV
jgi:hypothetical protein